MGAIAELDPRMLAGVITPKKFVMAEQQYPSMEVLQPAVQAAEIPVFTAPYTDNPTRISSHSDEFMDHLYPAGLSNKEVVTQYGATVMIPRKHLFGTQSEHRYTIDQEERVSIGLDIYGMDFLKHLPPVVCALPGEEPNTMQLAIIDGHHRVRTSGRLKDKGVSGKERNTIPAVLVSLEQLTHMLNVGKPPEKQHDQDFYQKLIRDQIEKTVDAFKPTLPDWKKQKPIKGISSFEDLVRKFPSFDYIEKLPSAA